MKILTFLKTALVIVGKIKKEMLVKNVTPRSSVNVVETQLMSPVLVDQQMFFFAAGHSVVRFVPSHTKRA